LARRAARLEPGLLTRCKRAVNDGLDLSLDGGLHLEAALARPPAVDKRTRRTFQGRTAVRLERIR
jgi:hypothetical protein